MAEGAVSTDAPPVRYSVHQRDFDYQTGKRLRVFLDGVEMNEVIEYDCEAGTLLKNRLGPDQRPVWNSNRDDIERDALSGVVTVDWK